MAMIVEAENLSKFYPPKTRAVDDVSFQVEEGEVFGFLGPNGAGKTTTIRMLTTLASITSGKAKVAGFDVKQDPAKVRESIGVVPQELTADDELKGIENLNLLARLHHVPQSELKSRTSDLLRLFDLEEAAERRVRTYSGGMRRRLQMAMGLVHSPKILFLDEPTLGLDIQTRTKVWEYIKQLNKDGLSVFMTTHYLEEADSLCDRIAIIDHGMIKVLDSPARLKQSIGGRVLRIEVSNGVDLTEFLKAIPNVSEVAKEKHSYKMKLSSSEDTALFYIALFGNSFNPTSLVPSNINGFQLSSSQLDQVKTAILSQTFGGAATYISYLTAGIISLILVFNMAFGGIDLVLDRQLGFLSTLLTAPISRASIYFSGVLQNMVKAMALAFITFIVAALLPNGLVLGKGFGVLEFLGAFGSFALLAFALSCVFTALALSVKSIDSLVAIVNFATFPLVFTSTALFPEGGFPTWLATISNYNPITWATDGARLLMVKGMLDSAQLIPFGWDIAYLAVFALVMAVLGYIGAKRALSPK
jgi:ABC-2 type transport system ATP-binding protein